MLVDSLTPKDMYNNMINLLSFAMYIFNYYFQKFWGLGDPFVATINLFERPIVSTGIRLTLEEDTFQRDGTY